MFVSVAIKGSALATLLADAPDAIDPAIKSLFSEIDKLRFHPSGVAPATQQGAIESPITKRATSSSSRGLILHQRPITRISSDSRPLDELLASDAANTALAARFRSCIYADPPESGLETETDRFLKEQLQRSRVETMSVLQDLFSDSLRKDDVVTVCGLIDALGHQEENSVTPEGPIIAFAGLNSSSLAIQESSIQAFENWGSPKALQFLERVRPGSAWLNSYIARVLKHLRQKHGATC